MSKITIDLYGPDDSFKPLACPCCGSTQNLDLAIEGYWDCGDCGCDFWLSYARVATLHEPDWNHAELNDAVLVGYYEVTLTKT